MNLPSIQKIPMLGKFISETQQISEQSPHKMTQTAENPDTVIAAVIAIFIASSKASNVSFALAV